MSNYSLDPMVPSGCRAMLNRARYVKEPARRRDALLGGGVFSDRVDRSVSWLRRSGNCCCGHRENSVLRFPGCLPGDLDHGCEPARHKSLKDAMRMLQILCLSLAAALPLSAQDTTPPPNDTGKDHPQVGERPAESNDTLAPMVVPVGAEIVVRTNEG